MFQTTNQMISIISMEVSSNSGFAWLFAMLPMTQRLGHDSVKHDQIPMANLRIANKKNLGTLWLFIKKTMEKLWKITIFNSLPSGYD